MSQRKSRRDFIQKPYFKKSHSAMYVDIDGKPRRLCRGDKLTPEGGELYEKALAERGKTPTEIIESDDPTVAELVDDFLVWVQGQVKKEKLAPRTYKWYDEHLQPFARFIGTAMTVSQLKKSKVKQWLDKDFPDASDNTLNGAVRAVARVFNWAKETDVIAVNPIARMKRESYTPRVVWLSDIQWSHIVAVLSQDDPFTDFVWFLYLTGCRPYEARIARDFHFNDDCLIYERKNSKGKKASRVIELQGKALAIVQRRIGDGLIFTNRNGKPWTAYALNCRFRRLRDKLAEQGHTFPLFAYVLRHTFATRALKRGVSRATLAVMLGHTSTAMVDKVYGHVGEDRGYLRAELRRATA